MAVCSAVDMARLMVVCGMDRGIRLSKDKLCNIMVLAWIRYRDLYGRHLFDVRGVRGWCCGFKIADVWTEWGTYPVSMGMTRTEEPSEELVSDTERSGFADRMLVEYGRMPKNDLMRLMRGAPALRRMMDDGSPVDPMGLQMVLSDEIMPPSVRGS